MMQDFYFINPYRFLLLLLIPFFVFILFKFKISRNSWSQVISPHLVKSITLNNRLGDKFYLWPLVLAWIIAVISLAGPSYSKEEKPLFIESNNRLFLFDLSRSMSSTDTSPTRSLYARYAIQDVIDGLKGGSLGLIAYSDFAYLISPLTKDKGNILNLLRSLDVDIMPSGGSAPVEAFTLAASVLEKTSGSNTIVWVTDGFNAEDISGIKKIIPESVNLIIYLVGTSSGSAIKLKDNSLLKDEGGNLVLSKVNVKRLVKIASPLRANIIHAQNGNSYAKELLRLASKTNSSLNSVQEDEEQKGFLYKNSGYILVFLLLIFSLLSFRRNSLYSISGFLILFFMLDTNNVHAATKSIWKNSSQAAKDAMDEKRYADAAEFSEENNLKAAAYYRAGDFQKAASFWYEVEGAEARYNQGNAHFHLQDFEDAIESYESALKENPNFPQAKHNLEMARKALEKQKEQEKNNKDKNKDNQDQDNQDQDQDKQDQDQDKQDQDKQDQDKQDQDKQDQDKQDQDKQDQDKQDQDKQEEKEQEEKEQEEKEQEEKEQEEQQAIADEQEASQAKDENDILKENMPKELKMFMNKIKDDPELLLRNKMQLDYQRKMQNKEKSKEINSNAY